MLILWLTFSRPWVEIPLLKYWNLNNQVSEQNIICLGKKIFKQNYQHHPDIKSKESLPKLTFCTRTFVMIPLRDPYTSKRCCEHFVASPFWGWRKHLVFYIPYTRRMLMEGLSNSFFIPWNEWRIPDKPFTLKSGVNNPSSLVIHRCNVKGMINYAYRNNVHSLVIKTRLRRITAI